MMIKKIQTCLNNNRPIILILVIALFLRLAYIFFLHPPFNWSDAAIYDIFGKNLSMGFGYSLVEGIPNASREPGYSLFVLAPVYWLFGHSIVAVQLFQTLINLLAIFLTYYIGRKYFSNSVALLGAFLLSFHFSSFVYVGELLTENFFQTTILIGFIIFLRALSIESKRLFFLSGFVFGIAALTRSNSVFLFVSLFFPIFFAFKNIKKSFLYSSLIGLGIILVVSPWIVRNFIHFDSFIFGRTEAGIILWSGSYLPTDGDWIYEDPTVLPEIDDSIKYLPYGERNAAYMNLALKNITSSPLGVAWIYFKKPFKILFSDNIANNFQAVVDNTNGFLFFKNGTFQLFWFKRFLKVFHIFTVLIAFFGFVLNYRRNFLFSVSFLFMIGYFLSTYMPFNAVPRYIVPFWPYIFLFVAVALLRIYNFFLLKKKNY